MNTNRKGERDIVTILSIIIVLIIIIGAAAIVLGLADSTIRFVEGASG